MGTEAVQIVKIGLTLPMSDPDVGVAPRYRQIRELALRAERDGFDSVWVYDHLLFRDENHKTNGTWEAWTLLSALAEATETIELGALVMCTAFRNPGLLAKMADALDEVSGGRLILGLGAGWHEPEFTAFGYPFDHLAGRFEDGLRIIAPLLRTGAVDYQGQFEQAIDCVSLPRGPRVGGPPILIGAFGPRLLRLTAELADAWNTCWLPRASELPEKLAPLHAACADVGRQIDTLEITVGQIVTFPNLPQEMDFPEGNDKYTFSNSRELAAEWAAFSALGVGHMMVWATPRSDECLDLVTEALRIFRQDPST
jgi:alkanesulfonate monooxygenase SsuD/methylene tetrahydromethanopterin reductase-like flavin-dependent oxidoreductase (luciferase family)